MRYKAVALAMLALAGLTSSGFTGAIRVAPAHTVITPVKIRPALLIPKTGPAAMNRPGPVRSTDPYFTLKIGDNEVYRDAKDHTRAYYRPVLKLAKRAATPLAEGVGELAGSLDAFRLRYYRFESGGNPKWGSMQVVVTAEQPADVSLEAVQQTWRDVTRLDPLPFRLDATTGTRMILPYPPRTVTLSQLDETGGGPGAKWYAFSTNTHPTPADLLSEEDSSTLNESKVRDFASLIISDLSDMPSFQPVLEVRAVYPGWSGASPLMSIIGTLRPVTLLQTKPATPTPQPRRRVPSVRIMKLAGESLDAAPGFLPAAARQLAPRPMPTLMPRRAVTLRPGLIRVVGALKPREDINYTYSDQQELVARIPISYPKGDTENYDYYFLSDSGRFGGPYFEPSPLPDRPQRADPPEGFTGYWYESHSFGKRLIWPAPKNLRLRWEVDAGLRPSCRFSLTGGEGEKLTAHLTYTLYPDFSTRELAAAVAELSRQTGEKVELLPFTDLLDANQIVLSSGGAALNGLIAAKHVSVTKLSPETIDDAWLRLAVDMPIEDWATFTLLMKAGELGAWDCGLLTGAGSGLAEKATFQLNGDLLQTIGGPVVAQEKSYDSTTGGYEVSFDNYGLAPLAVKGMRVMPAVDGQKPIDVWFDGVAVNLPGVGSASSFDQAEGASGSTSASVKVDAAPDLKSAMGAAGGSDFAVRLAADMVAPSTEPDAAGGVDPDILFSFLRSLCYQYVGGSEVIQVPVAPAEWSQWSDYQSGRIISRFQGFVYTKQLDLTSADAIAMRRLPREGAYASAGRPGDADLLEYRAIFVKKDGTVVNLPAQPASGAQWLTGDVSGINLDMTQAQ